MPSQTPAPLPWSPPDPLPRRCLTERLEIRFYDVDDAPALFEAIDTSRETLVRWLPWAATQHRTVESSREAIARFHRVRDSRPMSAEDNAIIGYVMGVFERATGRLVGGAGFNRIVHAAADAETGYWLRADARGRGFCTEATGAIIHWGLMTQTEGGWGFHRVRIFAASANAASCAVPRRLGMRQEAVHLRDRWIDGLGWCDSIGWARLADERPHA